MNPTNTAALPKNYCEETSAHDAQPALTGCWRDVTLVALLLLTSLGLRGWLLFNTEVPARDSIGFIRYALAFESTPWSKVVSDNHQHPAYPLFILAMSLPVRAHSDMSQVDAMVFSSQLASGLAAVLLVIPMYFLGKFLFHPAAGFSAALLFQFLPVPAQVLSDGLSESLFLLLSCTAMAFGVLAVQGNRIWAFACCGVFCGLAYLTRPEGALVAAAVVLVLIAMQVKRMPQRTLRQSLTCGAVLAAAAMIVGAPYIWSTGGLSNKPSISQMFGSQPSELKAAQAVPSGTQSSLDGASPRTQQASVLGVTLNLQDSRNQRAAKAVFSIGNELIRCFHYFACLPLLLGMWWFRGTFRTHPGHWVVGILCGLMALAVWRLAVHVGYFSDRHLLVLVLCGCYPVAAALWELPKRWTIPVVPASIGSIAILAALILPGLPKAMATLHANRAGYHAAGLWLAKHATTFDVIEDDHCWAHYYAGHVFRERAETPLPANAPVRFVVIGRREREINLTWNRPPPLNEDKLRADGGRIVYHWPTDGGARRSAHRRIRVHFRADIRHPAAGLTWIRQGFPCSPIVTN